MPMDELSVLGRIAVWALPFIFAVTVHEVAHGWVASKLGDQTARSLGRLTLNPIPHMHLIGTVIAPAVLLVMGGFMFGWAKPVPVNARNFNNPKRDMVYVAIAGPLANLLMALAWGVLLKIGYLLGSTNEFVSTALIYMGYAGTYINIILMVLNLLPILPLDGGRVLAGLLPNKASFQFSKLERFGLPILIVIIVTDINLELGLLSKILSPPVYFLQTSIFKMLGL